MRPPLSPTEYAYAASGGFGKLARMNDTARHTVVVTGLGAVTPVALTVDSLWKALLAGADALSDLDRFDTGGIACTRAGLTRGYRPPAVKDAEPPASLAEAFALGAAVQAAAQAGLTPGDGTAVIAASNFGALDAGEATLATEAADFRRASLAHGSVTRGVARALALGGPPATLSLSCASGASALAYAAARIRRGDLDRAVVIGFDALSRCAWSGLCALRTMTRDTVRPFDRNRSGTVFSEGAAALVLESAAAAARRGVRPLARLAGWATGNNGFHMTAPAPLGAGSAQVMREALRGAALAPEAVDHFNAHGTGTKPNDVTEFQALEAVLGDRARTLPVTANKSVLGHMLGAAGAVEALISVLTLLRQAIPPTTHFETPDPECPVNLVTRPQPAALQNVLSNAAGFGGCNAALLFTACV